MRILVTWVSKRGGTESIGRIIGDVLRSRGFDVVAAPAGIGVDPGAFDAAIIGGALYANRWPGRLRRFVNRNTRKLRRIPVWFFSSGPLDDSAERQAIPATRQVGALAERVGARGHVTFGGRLEADARGFPASAMARERSGDWRNPDRVRAWTSRLADELPDAAPGSPVEQPAHSVSRLLRHGILGWTACTALMLVLLRITSVSVAIVVHAILAPVIFAFIGLRYFRVRGARDALPTAATWTATVGLLDFFVVGLLGHNLGMFASIAGTWLPFALIFLSTWIVGEVVPMMKAPAPA